MIDPSPEDEARAGTQAAMGAGTWLTLRELLLLVILAAVQFTHIVDFTIIMPLGPVFSREMRLTPRQFGAVVAAYTISAGIAGLLAARFLDRFDRKSVSACALRRVHRRDACCVPSPPVSCCCWQLAPWPGHSAALSLRWYSPSWATPSPTRAGAWPWASCMSAFAVASFAGVPLGLFLAETYGWCSVFAVLGGVSAGVLALAAAALPPLRGHLEHAHLRTANAWEVLTDPNHLRAFALTSVLIISSFMLGPYLATFLVYNVGVHQEDLKFMYLCGGLATLVTMTVFGRLADRFGKLLVFRILATFTLVPIADCDKLAGRAVVAAGPDSHDAIHGDHVGALGAGHGPGCRQLCTGLPWQLHEFQLSRAANRCRPGYLRRRLHPGRAHGPFPDRFSAGGAVNVCGNHGQRIPGRSTSQRSWR